MWDVICTVLWYWALAFTPGVVVGMGIMHLAQGLAIDGNQPAPNPDHVMWDPSGKDL